MGSSFTLNRSALGSVQAPSVFRIYVFGFLFGTRIIGGYWRDQRPHLVSLVCLVMYLSVHGPSSLYVQLYHCISYPEKSENLAKIVKLDLDDQQTYGKNKQL